MAFFFFSLILATLPAVLGYFVLFSSTKTQGAVGILGRVLAVWLFALAALFPAAGAYVTLAGFSPLDGLIERMESMHGR